MSGSGRDQYEQHSFGVPFDPDNDPNCDLTKENVQEVIEELCNIVSTSASPGFTWGRSGNLPNGTWLLNDTVPSNRAGRTVALVDGEITRILVASEDIDTYDISIYEHEGDEINLTHLVTKSIVASRTGDFAVTGITLTSGRQLAVQITSGSAKNITVGVFLSGASS